MYVYDLDDEANRFFWKYDEICYRDRALDEFEEILNYDKEPTDPAWLRIVALGTKYMLVADDTPANRLRYDRQGTYILGYLVHRTQTVMKACESMERLIPLSALQDLVKYGLEGNAAGLEETMKRMQPFYQSDNEKRARFEYWLSRVRIEKETQEHMAEKKVEAEFGTVERIMDRLFSLFYRNHKRES